MIGILALALACGSAGEVRSEDTATLAGLLAEGKVPLLIDVRTPEEFADGHIAEARNVPVDELDRHLGELASYRGSEIRVICRSGGRSRAAAQRLAAEGFVAVDVTGGMSAWNGPVSR